MEMLLGSIGILLGIALFSGVIQGVLAAKLNGKILRICLLGPLPIALGLACLYIWIQSQIITGWDRLGWYVYLACAGSALFGTMIGWTIGIEKRKKRQVLPATPKEDL